MGTLNLPMRFEELSSLSNPVRKEVLTGELTRRLRNINSVQPGEVDSLVKSLTELSLPEVVEGINNPEVLANQVQKLKAPPTPEATPQRPISVAPSSSVESPQQAPSVVSLASTPIPPASAPEHPSTPISYATSISDVPRTSSPAGSIMLGSEKDKLLASVTRLHPAHAAVITDLLLSLPKKERALCLFNPEYLRNKVAEAVDVLEADDDAATAAPVPVPAASPTPITAPILPTPDVKAPNGNGVALPPPKTPEPAPAVVESPAPVESPLPPVATVHTLASLARLPAIDIISLASSQNATGLPLPKADPEVFKTTDAFIDGLDGQSEGQKKQVVGQKL